MEGRGGACCDHEGDTEKKSPALSPRHHDPCLLGECARRERRACQPVYLVDENGASERHVKFWILNKLMQNYDGVSIQVTQGL